MTKRVLILCTGNSCRSQMAEALWQSLGAGAWQAHSAGSKPTGKVHPLAVRVMKEIGIDIANFRSKSVAEFGAQPFDVAITVCDNAREACPIYPTAKSYLHWPFDDPADAAGTETEQLMVFRRVRDEIGTKIRNWLQSLNQEI
ncbi:MAG: arsenate reductase ArsC [Planctomycetaceae bacterium]|nr:arsenate reductase ArsC [Planctomycetaceae bacterium]